MNYPVFLVTVERSRHYFRVLCPPASPCVTTASRLFDDGTLCGAGPLAACEEVEEQVEAPLLLLLVTSQLLMGASLAVYYAVAISRLDCNVLRTQMPLFYGFLLLLRILAHVIGYVVGALVVPWGAAPPGGPRRH